MIVVNDVDVIMIGYDVVMHLISSTDGLHNIICFDDYLTL